jgi:hypothetical protein
VENQEGKPEGNDIGKKKKDSERGDRQKKRRRVGDRHRGENRIEQRETRRN